MKHFFKVIGDLFRGLYRKVLSRFNYDKYLEYLGVNFPRGGVHVYGRVEWQTEPWIITLGNNVHITDGVKFITHDGSTLIYRQYTPDLEVTKP
ncbi:MAG: acyltransferase, partial [Oscillibacter sp.]|nr:acyltransferase [Oscillibacter sp.]